MAFVALPIAVMVSLWAALWANEWASGQRDSWALRMPYAYLTHSLRKSLTIGQKLGKLKELLKQEMHMIGTTGWQICHILPLPLLHL